MSHALYQQLKILYPDASINVLAPVWCKDVVQRMPCIDQLIEQPIPHGRLSLIKRWNLAVKLRAHGYTHAIVLPGSFKSALIPWLAGIKQRTGWLAEMRFGLLNNIHYKSSRFAKMVERYCALAFSPKLLKDANKLEVPYPKLITDIANIYKLQQEFKLDFKEVIIVCPGAAYGPAKQWLAPNFAKVCLKQLTLGKQVWFFGSSQELGIINEIISIIKLTAPSSEQARVRCFAGKIKLLDTIDLMSQAQAVVANDSGLMHMAASVGTKVVALYGSSSPEFTPPLNAKAKILYKKVDCSPCFKRVCPYGHYKCMHAISVDEVNMAIEHE